MEQTSLLTIEQQKTITLTAIEGVISFSQTQILLSNTAGRIAITGENLKITGFSKQNGTFSAVGSVTGVKFLSGKLKLKNRLFK